MFIQLDNLHAKVTHATEAEQAWLYAFLTFKDPSARYRARGTYDGHNHLYSVLSQTFPTGVLPLVQAGAKEAGYTVELADLRRQPCAIDPTADLAWLRDRQHESVEIGVAEKRGIFWYPTSFGKTECMIGLSLVLPCRWLVAVNRKELLHQTAERYLARTGEVVGKVGDGLFDTDHRVIVGMFQTLVQDLGARRRRFPWEAIQAFHADECQGVPAATSRRVLMALLNAYFRFGWSATPLARGDRKGLVLIAATGPVIHRVMADVLVAEGTVAKPRVRMIPNVVPAADGLYHDVYEKCIVRNAKRNAVVLSCVQSAIKPVLLFVREVAHGRILLDELQKAGVQSEFTWGERNTPERQAALRRLAHGDTDVLIASVILQEGVDCPEIQSIVNAAAGESAIASIQQAGRGMRRHDRQGREVKSEFFVYDVDDQGCGCGGAHPSCRWLRKHALSRRRTFLKEGYEVTAEAVVPRKRKKKSAV